MRKNMLTRVLLVLLVGILFSTLAAAQPAGGTVLDSLTKMLGGESLPDFYNAYYQWIDLIVYIFLFVFIAKSSLGRMVRDQGTHSKLPVVLGVVLAVSAAVFESQVGFRLSDFGPIALGILFAVLGFAIFQFISGSGFAGRSTWAFAYVIAYGFMAAAAPQYYVWLQLNAWFLFLSSLLDILFIVAIGVIIFAVFGFVTGRGGGHTPGAATHGPAPHGPGGGPAEADARSELIILRDLRNFEEQDLREIVNAQRYVDEAMNLLNAHARELRNREVQDEFLASLNRAYRIVNAARNGEHHITQLLTAFEQRLQHEYRTLHHDMLAEAHASRPHLVHAGREARTHQAVEHHIEQRIQNVSRSHAAVVRGHAALTNLQTHLTDAASTINRAIAHSRRSRDFPAALADLTQTRDNLVDAFHALEALEHINQLAVNAQRMSIPSLNATDELHRAVPGP